MPTYEKGDEPMSILYTPSVINFCNTSHGEVSGPKLLQCFRSTSYIMRGVSVVMFTMHYTLISSVLKSDNCVTYAIQSYAFWSITYFEIR